MLNTYGLKMKGIRAVAGETEDRYDGCYLQVSYDIEDGEVLSNFHTANSWSQYKNSNIIQVANIVNKRTMQEIADLVKEAYDRYKNNINY